MPLLADVTGGCHANPLLRLTAANSMQEYLGNKYKMLWIPPVLSPFPFLLSILLGSQKVLIVTFDPLLERRSQWLNQRQFSVFNLVKRFIQ